MSNANPWLPAPAADLVSAALEPEASATEPVGVLHPQQGVPAPRVGLPAIPVRANNALWWVGAHGGAGVSTLTGLVPDSASAGRAWPDPVGGVAHCVLVCRSSITGLRAAQTAMTQWAAGAAPAGVQLHGLVVLADAPGRKLPRELRDFIYVLRGGVPRLWVLGWVEEWRTNPAPTLAGAPRGVASLVADLVDLKNSLATAQGTPDERYTR